MRRTREAVGTDGRSAPPPAGAPGEAERGANLDLNVGRACNLRCIFCVTGDETPPEERRWVPLAKAEDELRRGHAQGCRSLSLLGGEVTVYPHVFAVLGAARTLGFRHISIVTNGVRLGEPARLDALLQAGVSRFAISIHSHRADLEDWITTVPGSFARKVAGIRDLTARIRAGAVDARVAVNPVLCAANLPYLVDLLWFFAALGVRDVRFNLIHAIGRAFDRRALVPPLREAGREALAAVRENEARLRLRLTFSDLPLCAWPPEFLADADLMRRYLGERFDRRTRAAVWNTPLAADDRLERFSWVERRQSTLKAKPPGCERCRLSPACEGLWRKNLEIWPDCLAAVT